MTTPLDDDRYEDRIELEDIGRCPMIPGLTEYESALQYLKGPPRINVEKWDRVAKTFPLGKISTSLEDFQMLDSPFMRMSCYPSGYSRPSHVDKDGWLWRVRSGSGSTPVYYKHSILTEEQKEEAIKQKIPFRYSAVGLED